MKVRGAFHGFVSEESSDKGISMLTKVTADGKQHDVEIINGSGMEGAPMKGWRVLCIPLDDADGKIMGFAFPAPAQRTDGKKPGETMHKNYKHGQTIHQDDEGHTAIASPNGDVTATAHGKVETQSGADNNVLAGGVVNLAGLNGAAVLTTAGPSTKVFAII